MTENAARAGLGRNGWLLYALGWLPAVLLYAVATAAQPRVIWWHALTSGFVVMGFAALMGVLVWRLTGRVRVGPNARFALIHLLAAAVYSAAWLGALMGWLALVAGKLVVSEVFREAGLWQLSTGLYVYALLAGFFYLIRTQKQLRERESAAARAQLQTLRAQMNPHFLFNALHAVGSLVRTDAVAAERAIEQLGDLLRGSLDHSRREVVTLAEEWEFVKGYLELETLRLGQRLQLDVTIDPLALPLHVPALILQPLVENAVRHGVAQNTAGGTVRINASRANGTLTLTVSDNGPGAAGTPARGVGFGLDAVRGQLAGRYAGAARMAVDTAPGRGFTVTLTIPATES